jgi:hypothetical protein
MAVIANVNYTGAVLELSMARAAARILGLAVITFEIRHAEDIAPAFEALKAAQRHFVSVPNCS